MREWQVGDPAGDGNDIGVPDIKYMGYLKEDEDDEDGPVEDFRFCFNQFHGGYRAMNYEIAFDYLYDAFKIYHRLSREEKRQLSDNPFSHRYVVELCSNIYNRHDENQKKAAEIIKRHNIPINVCDSCSNIYPSYYKQCVNCGRSFENSENEVLERLMRNILERIVYDKSSIGALIERSFILMESNGSNLTGIEETGFLSIDFIFEKEHEYFTTTYRCLFNQEYHDTRIFEDFEISHDHSRLLSNETFQNSISQTEMKTGFHFRQCSGGYGARLDKNRYDFIFTHGIYVEARFDMPNSQTAVFKVDLDSLQLSRDYRKC